MGRKPKLFYAFGPFVLDAAQRRLSREGAPVSLTPKTYKTLLALIQNRGRVLSKEELLTEVWPDGFVDEANLPQQISTIRKALGEKPTQSRYIITVPGSGYRFGGEVREWSDEAAAIAGDLDSGSEDGERKRASAGVTPEGRVADFAKPGSEGLSGTRASGTTDDLPAPKDGTTPSGASLGQDAPFASGRVPVATKRSLFSPWAAFVILVGLAGGLAHY
jgi:DNA-binding winged helix-turn-helix (wHTH) protein